MAHWPTIFQLYLILLFVHVAQFSEATWPGPRLFNLSGSINNQSTGDLGTTWAVLIAGSKGYYNYRHQADICHAYQILKKGGLNDENIIVFMYDDIAFNPLNPVPGIIFNNPRGPDVYADVPKDYTGENVTAANFHAVLLGNKAGVSGGSGKVLASKPNDKIFIYYADHGGPGVLGMPNTPFIFADDLIQVLNLKYASRTYSEMVIYVDASESGTMFQGMLPMDWNIYVTTATNMYQNSWATYCPETNPPPPAGLEVCIGDLYSISWMENSESEDLRNETLRQQYLKVKMRTYNNHSSHGSQVMQYGTLHISNETVSEYQGSLPWSLNMNNSAQSFEPMGVVNQRDADLYSMWQTYKKSTKVSQQKDELLKEINEITAYRAHLDRSVDVIKGYLLGKGHESVRSEGAALVDDWKCLKSMVRTFETHCGSLTQYGMKHTRTFANICNNGVTAEAMDKASKMACSRYNLGQWNPAFVGYSA
ncbi:vacuolar-processing enzyme beta-isozyme-like [Cynara cardunculus var. scolymus]|uniref:vacuolar-processing enzyme beta-isozyme-like n=1 Tax=Cynara cardunculus var. scolymus TaxID=59895 RepID=UPI000D6280B1|nr:vacuolar-processing enzyme beta-isozyme-like [Cynara cardunculus var. scolymus]